MRRVIVVMFVLVGITLAASQWVVAGPSSQLTYLGSTGGDTNAIDIAGQYAYVSEGLGLTVLDISDPNLPVAVGRTEPFAIIYRLVVSGDYVYAAVDPWGDLWVIDVSDPTEPVLVTSDDSYWVREVTIDGSYLYAGCFADGLHIYDISDPSVLQEVGHLPTTGMISGVDVDGGVAYVANSFGGVWIVDVSDPANPEELTRIEVPSGQDIHDVAVAGDYLYAGYENIFRVIDVSDPAHPVEVGATDLFGVLERITLSGDLAFVVASVGDLVSIDISDPANPQVLSTHSSEYWASDLAVNGQYLYYTDDSAGVWVVDMTVPAVPVEAGEYNTVHWLQEVVARDDYAYVADQEEGLMVVDVSDPVLPQAVGFYNSPSQFGAWNLALYGNYIYLDADFDGLRVLDISDPTSPGEVASLPTGGAIDFQNGYAYMVAGQDFHVLDVSDPANPTQVAVHDVELFMESVQVSGDYAYVTAGTSGLLVFDISDPQAVTQVGLFTDSDRYVEGVALMDDYALVAVRYRYVLVLDVSDPTQIEQVGSYSVSPNAVAVEGNLAYIAGLNKVEVVDVSNPADPILVDSMEFTDAEFQGVYASDGRAYAWGTDIGLLVYSTQPVPPGDERIYLPIVVR